MTTGAQAPVVCCRDGSPVSVRLGRGGSTLLMMQLAQSNVGAKRVPPHESAKQQPYPSVAIALQLDVTTPEFAEWHRQVSPRAGVYPLVVEDSGFKFLVAILLGTKVGQSVIIIVDEMFL